jgi:hypothetical protein
MEELTLAKGKLTAAPVVAETVDIVRIASAEKLLQALHPGGVALKGEIVIALKGKDGVNGVEALTKDAAKGRLTPVKVKKAKKPAAKEAAPQ